MTQTQKFSIPAPVDPEMANVRVRDTLEFSVTLPFGFEREKQYGLVFCIPGYGDHADSDYQANKLRPYIAEKYKMIVVGVRYHNDIRTSSNVVIDLENICSWYQISMDYFKDSQDGNQIIEDLFNLLISRKIRYLDSRLALKVKTYHKYSSFGFMPALDHLHVLFFLLQNFNIDKSHIIAFGSSYGGYIACLMAKYAPHTFSLVIENSGFCVTQLNEVFIGLLGGTGGSFPRYVDGQRYEIPTAGDTLWSVDETSPYYFSDAHKRIRSLLRNEHRTPSETVYCSYHSIKDEVAPIALKDQMCEQLRPHNTVYYKRIEERDIDGTLFKNMRHAMDASLQKLFDISIMKYLQGGHSKPGFTDFDQQVSYGFPCADKYYNFSFSNEGLQVQIEPIQFD